MAIKTSETEACAALVQRLEDHATGVLSVRAGFSEIKVSVQKGRILAASSPRDCHNYIRLLYHLKLLDQARSRSLLTRKTEDADLFDDIFDGIPDRTANRILDQRLEENLCGFLGHKRAPRFEHKDMIFATHMSLRDDAAAMVTQACALFDAARGLPGSAGLKRGETGPTQPIHRVIMSRFGDRIWALLEFLPLLPFEPTTARSHINAMIALGVLQRATQEDHAPHKATDQPGQVPARAGVTQTDDSDMSVGEEEPESEEDMAIRMLSWFNDNQEGDEDEMAMFSDTSQHRGGDQAGTFVTETHNLDKVEVADLSGRTSKS